uniref:Uncharacterized protein n=1 Tax=Panagrolaimus superbus TaxID=310955 RepID=A0A914Z8S6_9BILA
MGDRRSAIRSTDNRAEKHVAFKSPLMSVRSITPLSDMIQIDSFRSPTRSPQQQRFDSFRSPTRSPQQQQNHQQQRFQFQSPKRPASNPAQSGTPAKRRVPIDAPDNFSLSNATLDDIIVRNTLRVQMINEKVNGLYDQIPGIFEIADATLDKTSNLVIGLHDFDNEMHSYVDEEKEIARKLNQFLRDVSEAEELDLSEFSDDFEKIEEEIDNYDELLDDMLSEDEEDSEHDYDDDEDDL